MSQICGMLAEFDTVGVFIDIFRAQKPFKDVIGPVNHSWYVLGEAFTLYNKV